MKIFVYAALAALLFAAAGCSNVSQQKPVAASTTALHR
jgi:hypothetical protein